MNARMQKRMHQAQTGLRNLASARTDPSTFLMTGRYPNLTSFEYDLSGPAIPFAVEPALQSQLQRLQDILRQARSTPLDGNRPLQIALVSGGPGTGKSSLAPWMAYQAEVHLYRLSASELVGLTAKSACQSLAFLFRQAIDHAPAILLLDDLQALETAFPQAESREIVHGELFRQMQALDGKPVLLLLATRCPERLGAEWFQPGRIETQVELNLPDSLTRLAILRQHTRSLRLAFDVNLISLARSAPGLSGADLAELCRQADLRAAAQHRQRVNMADFQAALERYLLDHADTRLADEV